MALVVESTSSASSTATSVSITKPAGVAVGDLLLILAATGPTQSYVCSGFTAGYSELYDGPGGITDSGLQVLYRIADASDVSASTYSVTGGSAIEGTVVAMMRISGWVESNPIYQDADGGFNNTTSGTFTLSSLSLSRLSQQVLIMVMTSYDNGDSDYYGDASNLTVTSADANPTWTELCNIKAVTNASTGVSAKSMTVGYATTTSSATITAFSFDYLEYGPDSTAGGFGGLLLLEQPANATGTHALLEVTPTIFSEAAVEVGTTGSNSLLEVSPTINTQSGTSTAPTQWQSPTKESTTWTNKNI